MQYLYTLTSTPNDIYYEQFFLSAFSLKQLMPDAEIMLLCDSKTKETLTGKRSGHEKLVLKTIAVDAPDDLSQVEVSRWVRTSMRRLVPGDFLFLDGDTIVTDDLSAISRMERKFGACMDKHLPIHNHSKKESIIQKNRQLGFDSHISDKHYNGGVLFCPDTPETHAIFARWHELWLLSKRKNIVRDQPALNMAIHENQPSFMELDGTWNCQIAYNGLPYLSKSKIVHYFATDMVFNESPFLLAQESIHRQIKNTGFIPDEALELLKSPRSAFAPASQIIAGSDMLFVINSSFFQSIFLLRKKIPFIFNFFNNLASLFKNITKRIIIKSNRKKDGAINIYN